MIVEINNYVLYTLVWMLVRIIICCSYKFVRPIMRVWHTRACSCNLIKMGVNLIMIVYDVPALASFCRVQHFAR